MKSSSESIVGSVRDFYDRIAPDYEQQRTGSAYTRLLSNLDQGVVFNGLVDGTALEVGPGSGRITGRLIQRGLDVTVCDVSSEMLELIAARYPTVPHLEAGISELPLQPNYGNFDNAIACRVLPHVPQLGDAIASVAGAVRPGGRVIFDLWNKWGYVGLSRRLAIKRSRVYTTFQEIGDMRELIHAAGLKIIRERGIGFPPVPPYPLELFDNRSLRRMAHIVMFVCEREPVA